MSTNDEKQYALEDAIWRGDHARAARLIAKGAQPMLRDELDDSPMISLMEELRWAEEFSDCDYFILEQVAPADVRDQDGNHAIHIAVRSGDVDTVATLIDLGTPPDLETKDGYTPLEMAKGDADMVEHLSTFPQRPPRDIPLLAWRLVAAADEMDIPAMKRYLAAGANPNGDEFNVCVPWLVMDTPLQLVLYSDAPEEEVEEAVRLLLEAGANPRRLQESEDETPLHPAALRHPGVVKHLLDAGAADVIDFQDVRRDTALILACSSRSPRRYECAKHLLEAGADPNIVADCCYTALDVASGRDDHEMCDLLRSYGAKTEEELKGKS